MPGFNMNVKVWLYVFSRHLYYKTRAHSSFPVSSEDNLRKTLRALLDECF